MYKLSLALVAAAALMLSGCGGGGGGTSAITPTDPLTPTVPTVPTIPTVPTTPTTPTTPTVVLTGTVTASNNNQGVGGVIVEFGQPPYGPVRATTASNGSFSITLPAGRTVMEMYPSWPKDFRVDSTFAGETFPGFLPVLYYGKSYSQSNISLTDSQNGLNVLAGQSRNLGTVTLTYFDPNQPPPPPTFP